MSRSHSKSTRHFFTLLAFVVATFLLLAAGHASAQVRMIKVDESSQAVTIKNFGASMTVDISAYFMCLAPGAYRAVSTLTIVGGGDLDLSPGEEVTVVYTFTPASGGMGLYLNDSGFGSAVNMADYVQYDGGVGVREPVAVTAGIWTASTFATGAPGPYYYSGDGTQNGAAYWSNVAPPTAVPGLGGWSVLVTTLLIVLFSAAIARRHLATAH